MSISLKTFLSRNSNQVYACSVCEFCGEVACYTGVFEAELGHMCHEHNKAWRNPSIFKEIPRKELEKLNLCLTKALEGKR